jgi:hypothetical protein
MRHHLTRIRTVFISGSACRIFSCWVRPSNSIALIVPSFFSQRSVISSRSTSASACARSTANNVVSGLHASAAMLCMAGPFTTSPHQPVLVRCLRRFIADQDLHALRALCTLNCCLAACPSICRASDISTVSSLDRRFKSTAANSSVVINLRCA